MRYAFLICLLVCLLLLLMMLVINSCSVQSCNAGHDLSGQTNKQISIISTSVQKRNTLYQNNKKSSQLQTGGVQHSELYQLKKTFQGEKKKTHC